MIGAMSISQLVGCEPKASRGAVLIGLQQSKFGSRLHDNEKMWVLRLHQLRTTALNHLFKKQNTYD